MAIPKIIHYCWLSDDPVPMDLQRYMETWKEKLHDYEFIKWDFSRFDINSSIWVKEAFENKKYAFAADYIRLYALYNYGGIYLDSDVEVLKSFNAFLDSDHMVGWEVRDLGVEAAIIGAEKNAKWVEKCLEYYSGKHFVKEDGSFDMHPLPQIVYRQLCKYNYIIEDTKIIKNSGEWYIYPSDFFSPKSYKDMKIRKTENTVAIHHFAGSWLTWDIKFHNRYRWISSHFPRIFHYFIYLPILRVRNMGI